MRLVDADALKQTIGSYNPIKYTYEYGDVVTVEDIDKAPTIEAEPVKRGKWITERYDCLIGRTYCSVCGHDAPFDGDEVWRSLWCPNCGAQMESEE